MHSAAIVVNNYNPNQPRLPPFTKEYLSLIAGGGFVRGGFVPPTLCQLTSCV